MRTKKPKTIVTDEITKVTCDYCNLELDLSSTQWNWSHSEWGGDSIDSYERRDVCGNTGCMLKFLQEAREDLKLYSKTANVNIEIGWKQINTIIKQLSNETVSN